jgi:hypothetical protein
VLKKQYAASQEIHISFLIKKQFVVLKKQYAANQEIHIFAEEEGSLSRSQVSTIGLALELDYFIPHQHAVVL